ncbi:hypothetical protein SAMN05444397_101433 [Flavobacterium aquidurense]|uniref:Glycosyl transferase family 2 n=1 Tax=Flavobacterium frigidimaris TaxID=262320 RepID=A0ABX4BLC3_FLAFR|nr:hypothetical protein [Flavobacterium frigidimaris]OXA76076.1 hypothetical protein B0A65_19680 [Flavobacterium frigidimaris]SDY35850.1 hypothetical protein SAMN05444397_101433 [Flavobacterium aquidurense]
MKGKIQVGYLVSYDYELLKNALPTTYKDADTIFLAIDINRNTWNGGSFTIDDSFFEWLNAFDVDKKVVIYEDDFYVPSLTTMECEIRERKMLSEKMGIGNWLIQIDCDEYFVDFKKFVSDLRKYDSYLESPLKKTIQVAAYWIILYKYTPNGILYVDKPAKAIFATNNPEYIVGRRVKGQVIYTNNIVLHESLSRSEEELRFKFENWGHNKETNKEFLNKWIAINENNYKEYKDLYYIEPERWKKLGYFPTKDMTAIKNIVEKSRRLNMSEAKLAYKNSEQWFKFLLK